MSPPSLNALGPSRMRPPGETANIHGGPTVERREKTAGEREQPTWADAPQPTRV